MESLLGSESTGQSAAPTPESGNPGAAATTTTQTPDSAPKTWRDSLPEDIRDNPTLKNFSDVANLAKSYIHAQSAIGKKGVIVPTDKSTDEEWSDFYKAIGVPDKDNYKIKLPEDREHDPEFINKFKEFSQENGILPKQAESFVKWYGDLQIAMAESEKKAKDTMLEQEISGLKKEWGDGFEKNVHFARMAVKEIGGEELHKYLNDSGLANNVTLTKFMAKVGQLMGEDKIRGEGGTRFGMTPDEIVKEHESIQAELWTLSPDSPRYAVLEKKLTELAKRRWSS